MSWVKPEGRIYPIDGLGRFWSVTTILGLIDKSAPLMYWAAKNAVDYYHNEVLRGQTLDPSWLAALAEKARKSFRQVREEAADVGSQVHALAEGFCFAVMDGRAYEMPQELAPEVQNAFGLFLDWARLVDLEPLVIEKKVWHPTHRYAGRLDMIARGYFDRTPAQPKGRWRKKRTYVIDTKTSKDFYDTFGPQVAAYAEGYKVVEPKGLEIEGSGCLRVGKTDGKPEFRDFTDHHEANFNRFTAIADAYYLWKGLPK